MYHYPYCIVYLYTAVLVIDSHPDHNKGQDPQDLSAGTKTHPTDRS